MAVLDRTYTLLGHEFEIDELKDIADHGMAMGVSGFIYYHENTCLLYTSPSPRDQRGSRMPSSA